MKTQQGFIGLPVLIAILLGVTVFGGGAYFVVQQKSASQATSEIPDTIIPTNTQTTVDTQTTQNTQPKTETQQPAKQEVKTTVNTPAVGDSNHEPGFVVNSFYSEKCPFITYSMVVGSSDATTEGQVSKLQDFLRLQNISLKPSTGYFGTDTLNAVAKWQGYIGFASQIKNPGTVGPVTQKQMNTLCVVRTYTFPKLGKLFVTPNGTPTIKVPDGWKSEVQLDTELKATQESGVKTKVSYTDSKQPHFHGLDFQIYANKTVDEQLALAGELYKNYHVGDPSKKVVAKTAEEYGLTYMDIEYGESDGMVKTRVFSIPGYTIILASVNSKEQMPDGELNAWYKTVFDSIVLPSSFNEFPAGVPIAQYVSKLNDSSKKIEEMKTIPKGTASDFYLSACYTFVADMVVGSLDKDTGGQVSNLQKMLFEKYKVLPSTITGRYDDLTLLYVIKFQREMGLEGTGGVGANTRTALSRCKTTN